MVLQGDNNRFVFHKAIKLPGVSGNRECILTIHVSNAKILMISKTFKTGNSIVISLPREALDYLGIQEGAEVTIKLDREHGHIVISPIDVPITVAGVDEEFSHQIKEFIEQYRSALEKLAG
jgi:antitoxin MazE